MLLPRFLRWLFYAEGVDVLVGKEDWTLLATMGSGAEHGLGDAGILSYEQGRAACDVLTRELAAPGATSPRDGAGVCATYGLDELVCFLCLSKHREAVSRLTIPPPAAPVSVAEELGVFLAPNYAPPCPLAWRPLRQARAQRKCPRWRTGALCPSPPTLLARVLPEVLRWARAREAAAIC